MGVSLATLWRVAFQLVPFSSLASLSSERNAVSISSALTMNWIEADCRASGPGFRSAFQSRASDQSPIATAVRAVFTDMPPGKYADT